MKKVIAKGFYPDNIFLENLFNFHADDISLFGNRQFNEHTTELYNQVVDTLDDLAEAFREVMAFDPEYEPTYSTLAEAASDILCDDIDYITAHKIYTYLMNHNGFYDDDDTAAVMSIISGEKYNVTTLHGCCQGEWIDCIYPAAYDAEYLEYIESVYFGLGYDFSIELYDDDDLIEDNWIYSYKWDYSDLIDNITNMYGVTRDEIEIQVISGYTQVPTFEIVA